MKYLLAVTLLISHLVVYTQPTSLCDTVWKKVEIEASYPGGIPALQRYNTKDLMHTVMECYEMDSIMITNMTMDLTINKKGDVVKAAIVDSDIPASCKARLNKKLIAMKGWIPAQNKGKPVCSIYRWHIICIRWEEE